MNTTKKSRIYLSAIGYDYGVKPIATMMGDMSFSEQFTKAKCLGLIFQFGRSKSHEEVPLAIAFLFQNEKPAEAWLDIMLAWISSADGNSKAIQLDFIERKREGYAVSISPDPVFFEKRMVPARYVDKITPISLLGAHYKEIDSAGDSYYKFKKGYSQGRKIAVGYVIGTPGRIIKSSSRHFVKTEFGFFTEDNIPPDRLASGYNRKKALSGLKTEVPSPGEVESQRNSAIKNYFPIAHKRLTAGWLKNLTAPLEASTSIGKIHQSICNIILFERIKQSRISKEEIEEMEYPLLLLDYLETHYESFDSYFPPDDFFTPIVLTEQLARDNQYLQKLINFYNDSGKHQPA